MSFFRLEHYLTTMHNRTTTATDINVQLVPLPLVFVDRLPILPILFTFVDRIHERIKSLRLSMFDQPPSKEKGLPQSNNCSSQSDDDQQKNCLMRREEVRFVIEKLELFCSKLDDDEETIGGDELTAMFEESEPSLEELKQTFNVFDRNRDGFIDEQELHNVLGLLESNKGIFIHDCKRMIARFDINNDGKIDFNEFVKFMEVALS